MLFTLSLTPVNRREMFTLFMVFTLFIMFMLSTVFVEIPSLKVEDLFILGHIRQETPDGGVVRSSKGFRYFLRTHRFRVSLQEINDLASLLGKSNLLGITVSGPEPFLELESQRAFFHIPTGNEKLRTSLPP